MSQILIKGHHRCWNCQKAHANAENNKMAIKINHLALYSKGIIITYLNSLLCRCHSHWHTGRAYSHIHQSPSILSCNGHSVAQPHQAYRHNLHFQGYSMWNQHDYTYTLKFEKEVSYTKHTNTVNLEIQCILYISCH